jgi:hypothetical protein
LKIHFLGAVPKTKRESHESNDLSFYKDRTHSAELRTSQDSYQRIEKRKARQNTCSSDVLNKLSKPSMESEFRAPFGKAKKNNYFYQVTNDENDSRFLNSKTNISRTIRPSESEKIQTLKTENKKLIYMLESTEKLMHKKLKESKGQVDKIMGIINKIWKVMYKQIMDPYQRRKYFDKNSLEEINFKKLLKENEKLRSNKESKLKLLSNLGQIMDI